MTDDKGMDPARPGAEAPEKSPFELWLEGRPPVIQDLARRFPPEGLYRIKSTGQVCQLYSYTEFRDGGVGFMVTCLPGQSVLFPEGHRVFGLKEDDIEPTTREYYDERCKALGSLMEVLQAERSDAPPESSEEGSKLSTIEAAAMLAKVISSQSPTPSKENHP
jgi:hypothetical protein